MSYIILHHDPSQYEQVISWDNRQYAEYRDAAMAAIDARDKFRAPGLSWTVAKVERMETFR